MSEPIKIKFRVEVEDAVAFTRFYQNIAINSWGTRLATWGVAGFIASSDLLKYWTSRDPKDLSAGIVWAVLYLILYKVIVTGSRRLADRAWRKEANRIFFGAQQLELGEKTLNFVSDFVKSETVYEAIPRVAVTPTHGFIFIGEHMAHSIPKAKVLEGDFEGFMNGIQSRIKHS